MENGPKEKKWAGNMPPDTPLVLGALGKGTNTLDVSHTNQLKHNEHYHACVVCVCLFHVETCMLTVGNLENRKIICYRYILYIIKIYICIYTYTYMCPNIQM